MIYKSLVILVISAEILLKLH